MNFFVTGTDTGAGKTYVSALLIRALRAAGHDTAGLKPICCGDRADAEVLQSAADGVLPLDDVNPVWFRFPGAPYTASMVENRPPDLARFRERYERVRARHRSLIVEGVGGWLVPITRDYSVADLAAELGLPILVVAANRLGVINHTLLTVRAIEAAGLVLHGVILNQMELPDAVAQTNRPVLEDLGVPVLCEVAYGQRALDGASFIPARP